VLDPQISYEGRKIDFVNNVMLSEHLEESKSNLFIYFHDNYTHAAISTPPSVASLSAQTSPIMGSPQKSFTAQYHRKEKALINKLEVYFKLPTEDFNTCDPVWWMGQCTQFPTLFCLARNILCIPGESFLHLHCFSSQNIFMPGSAVAVEWVFSGGQDTISLHCASLHVDTIQILMLVKKQLHLACAKANAALCG
jgi:hypothetical protein